MRNTIILMIAVCLFSVSVIAGSVNTDYPRSPLEKEMDDLGSIIGPPGVTFRMGKQKSASTRTKSCGVNLYLYRAALDVLKFAPLISADNKNGTIITEWYVQKDKKDKQLKVSVYITGDLITPEDLEVVVFQRSKEKGKWSKDHSISPMSSVFENDIIRKARELYLESKK